MRTVEIADDMIRLGQLLQLAGWAEGGAEAKHFIADGEASVNGEVELRRGLGHRHAAQPIQRVLGLAGAEAILEHDSGGEAHDRCASGDQGDLCLRCRTRDRASSGLRPVDHGVLERLGAVATLRGRPRIGPGA